MRDARIIIIISIFIISTTFTRASDNGLDWPYFHGPKRDNRSAETGLLKSWPENGPDLIWTASGLGHGYSTVSVRGGRIFTAGMLKKNTYVIALDRNGRELWRKLNGESWQASRKQKWAVSYAGARSTPTIDGETVYHLSELGSLTAFEAGTGKEKWKLNIFTHFDAPKPKYGYSESLLIHGDLLFCQPGGARGYIAALDKKDGRVLWANAEIRDPIGYSSPVLADIGGVEQVISLSAARVFSVGTDGGKLLWQYAFANKRNNNVADVVVHRGMVFAASGYGGGSIMLKPDKQKDGIFTVQKVWQSELMDNHHGGVLLLDGYLYGSGHEARGWTCMTFDTGEKRWQSPGKGSLTYADGHLYCLNKEGTMSLVKAIPEKWAPVSSFTVPRGGDGKFWAHPAICSGILYIRHSEKLYAYRIKKQE
ncbi:PQQ-binding-like beta-propeller repeat protein [Candidatus Riflebacteria bacterium]